MIELLLLLLLLSYIDAIFESDAWRNVCVSPINWMNVITHTYTHTMPDVR